MKGQFTQVQLRKALPRIGWVLALGACLYGVTVVWADWGSVKEKIAAIGVLILLGGALLVPVAYFFRFVRWHSTLRILGYRLKIWFNFRVYLTGLALTATPGKLGETARSILLLPVGVATEDSLAALLVDRSSDVLGVCLLGAIATAVVEDRASVLAWVGLTLLVISLAASAALGNPRVVNWVAGYLAMGTHSKLRWFWSLAQKWAKLWSLPRALLFSVYGCLAYGVYALVFALFCHAASAGITTAQAVSVFASATLLGAASMVPAGLGAMEAAMVLQLVELQVSREAAIAVAICSRVVTLWLGVLIGVFALLSVSRELGELHGE